MITQRYYTRVPEGIDLTQPLMPLRPPTDGRRCGVDLAWQLEVLPHWLTCVDGAQSGRYRAISLTPAAADINHGRDLAQQILNATTATRRIVGALPDADLLAATGPIFSMSGLHGHAVPSRVNVGDSVRRADIADMFEWMARGRCCVRKTDAEVNPLSSESWTVTQEAYGREADYSRTGPDLPSAPSGVILHHYWKYDDSYGPWSWQYRPGYEQRAEMSGGGISWHLPLPSGMSVSMARAVFSDADTFAYVPLDIHTRYDGAESTHTVYVRAADAIFNETVGVYLPPNRLVQLARQALVLAGETDRPRATSGQHEFQLDVTARDGSDAVLCLSFAADYRVPEGGAA